MLFRKHGNKEDKRDYMKALHELHHPGGVSKIVDMDDERFVSVLKEQMKIDERWTTKPSGM